MIGMVAYIMAVWYTFANWGFLCGLISIVFPIFPIIDLFSFLTKWHGGG